MKKTVLIAAIGSTMASGVAAAATNEDTEVKYKGIVEFGYIMKDEGDNVDNLDVQFNIAVNKELNHGLTGFANYRIDGGESETETKTDEARVGVKGSFGTITLGEAKLGTKLAEFAGDTNGDVSPSLEVITYSNNFGPVEVIVGYDGDKGSDGATFGVQYKGDFFKIGAGTLEEGDLSTTVVGAEVSYGIFTLGAMGGELDDKDILNIKAGIKSGDWSAAVTSSTWDDGDDGSEETVTRFDLVYSLGNGASIEFRVHTNNELDDDEYNRIVLSQKF